MGTPFYAGGLSAPLMRSPVARPTGNFDLGAPVLNGQQTAPAQQPAPVPPESAGTAKTQEPPTTKPTAKQTPRTSAPETLTSELKSNATGGSGAIPAGAKVVYFGGVPISLSDNSSSSTNSAPTSK